MGGGSDYGNFYTVKLLLNLTRWRHSLDASQRRLSLILVHMQVSHKLHAAEGLYHLQQRTNRTCCTLHVSLYLSVYCTVGGCPPIVKCFCKFFIYAKINKIYLCHNHTQTGDAFNRLKWRLNGD